MHRDLRRFTPARAVVKHAGLAPRERLSGTFTGKAGLTGAGRPGLRLAAWRAIFATLRSNPVHAARYSYLTTRAEHPLKPTQAQAAVAAALLPAAARHRHHRRRLGCEHRDSRQPPHPRGGTVRGLILVDA